MAEPPLEVIPPPAGSSDSPDGPVVNVTRTADFYLWPTLSTLPQTTIDTVRTNRGALGLKEFSSVPPAGKSPGGYSYGGAKSAPTKVIPDWVTDEKQKEVLQRFHDKEILGEGSVSAVVTGDGVGLTWGQGLGHKGALEPWVNQAFKLATGSLFKKRLLDLGITLESTTWKIVDADAGVVKVGDDAIKYIQGYDPAGKDTIQRILTAFAVVAEEQGPLAAEAQWNCLVNTYFKPAVAADGGKVMTTWSATAICYVMHCHMWGKFADWPLFAATGGDLQSILRLEVDFTGFYDDMGTYRVVPPLRGTNMRPSLTMLNDMGAGCMLGVLKPWDDAPQDHDIVFDMGSGKKLVLRGVAPAFLPDDELFAFVTKVNGYPMADILKAVEGIKAKLKKMRDLYNQKGSERTVASFGYRVQVAMDVVLAKGIASAKEKGSAIDGIYANNEYKILPVDQQEVIRKYLKGTVWDVWDAGNPAGFIAQIQGYSMSVLLSTLGARNYATVDQVRQAYESEGKPHGWRPWIAMVATLNRGGGSAAGWIVTHGGYKELPRDQRTLVRQTIGLPHSDADMSAEKID
jgi:hypothetical protein